MQLEREGRVRCSAWLGDSGRENPMLARSLERVVVRIGVVLSLRVIDEHRRVAAVQILFYIGVAVFVFVLRAVGRSVGNQTVFFLPLVRHTVAIRVGGSG